MTQNIRNPEVDFYFNKTTSWQKEIRALRSILLSSPLKEELKWGCPCYTFQKANIVLIHVFKEYCALLYFKGALLNDDHHILIQQTENVQSARQVRFTSMAGIKELENVLKAYTSEAIEVEKAGLKVELKKTADYQVPEEFKHKLDNHLLLKKAFEALTPGRQRAYLFYFAAPEQSRTRLARIEKSLSSILDGKGLND